MALPLLAAALPVVAGAVAGAAARSVTKKVLK